LGDTTVTRLTVAIVVDVLEVLVVDVLVVDVLVVDVLLDVVVGIVVVVEDVDVEVDDGVELVLVGGAAKATLKVAPAADTEPTVSVTAPAASVHDFPGASAAS
jgi:hypothetical protein